MFKPPELDRVRAYLGKGDISRISQLHGGQSLRDRIEAEVEIHAGQIEAENYLLNTFAKLQAVAAKKDIDSETFAQIMRSNHYDFELVRQELISNHGCVDADFDSVDFTSVNTTDLMRQRALMIGAVLSSTPIIIRDPWGGKPVTPQYGFSDFKAVVGDLSFSAVATPRYKGIPFRFAVMKHKHDGYEDNNPALIMSDEFCDAFELYNHEMYGDMPMDQHPLIVALATNFKPNIHDRFHNWLLYDVKAASEAFQKWGNDIYFTNHADKNPLLINYEQLALSFHHYTWDFMHGQNPGYKDSQYKRLENCVEEIHKFGDYLRSKGYPKANEIEESTVYAVVSSIGFVLNPWEERFQKILSAYPDVETKLLVPEEEGKGIAGTLSRLHSGDPEIPSSGAAGKLNTESVFEYIMRYPLHKEVEARLANDRRQAADDWQTKGDDARRQFSMLLQEFETLPQIVQERIMDAADRKTLEKLHRQLASIEPDYRAELLRHTEVSEEGYLFFRVDRHEIDYPDFQRKNQDKKVLLVEIPEGTQLDFVNDKTLAVGSAVRKQEFHLQGGKDLLAINVRDESVAKQILDAAMENGVVNPFKLLRNAQEMARMIAREDVRDMYKIEKEVAARIYDFNGSGFYQRNLEKYVAKSPGPVVMQLHSGGDQRLVNGAMVYLRGDKEPEEDDNPDCHCMERRDFERDYQDRSGFEKLPDMSFKSTSSLGAIGGDVVLAYMRLLGSINLDITHGRSGAKAQALF